MTGVSMHQTWKIGNSGYYLGVALSHPFAGAIKATCDISKSQDIGKIMYDKMNDNPGKAQEGPYAVKWCRDYRYSDSFKVTIVVAGSSK